MFELVVIRRFVRVKQLISECGRVGLNIFLRGEWCWLRSAMRGKSSRLSSNPGCYCLQRRRNEVVKRYFPAFNKIMEKREGRWRMRQLDHKIMVRGRKAHESWRFCSAEEFRLGRREFEYFLSVLSIWLSL